jgi:hypothetical protein
VFSDRSLSYRNAVLAPVIRDIVANTALNLAASEGATPSSTPNLSSSAPTLGTLGAAVAAGGERSDLVRTVRAVMEVSLGDAHRIAVSWLVVFVVRLFLLLLLLLFFACLVLVDAALW